MKGVNFTCIYSVLYYVSPTRFVDHLILKSAVLEKYCAIFDSLRDRLVGGTTSMREAHW